MTAPSAVASASCSRREGRASSAAIIPRHRLDDAAKRRFDRRVTVRVEERAMRAPRTEPDDRAPVGSAEHPAPPSCSAQAGVRNVMLPPPPYRTNPAPATAKSASPAAEAAAFEPAFERSHVRSGLPHCPPVAHQTRRGPRDVSSRRRRGTHDARRHRHRRSTGNEPRRGIRRRHCSPAHTPICGSLLPGSKPVIPLPQFTHVIEPAEKIAR